MTSTDAGDPFAGKSLTEWELGLLWRFVSFDFQGVESLREQISATSVVARESSPGFLYVSLEVERTSKASDVAKRVPIELTGTDRSEAPMLFMLFVDEGYLAAIEGFRGDSQVIQELPDPTSLVPANL